MKMPATAKRRLRITASPRQDERLAMLSPKLSGDVGKARACAEASGLWRWAQSRCNHSIRTKVICEADGYISIRARVARKRNSVNRRRCEARVTLPQSGLQRRRSQCLATRAQSVAKMFWLAVIERKKFYDQKSSSCRLD